MLTSQGESCGIKPLEKNISEAERMLCVSGGSILALWGGKNLLSRNGLAALALGGTLLFRGLSGHCALYKVLKMRTDEPRRGDFGGSGKVDRVDEGSDESFPASDAPGWIGSSASGSRG